MNEKIDLHDVSFLIPVRIDSPERLANLKTVITYILRYFKTTILVLEADGKHSDLREEDMSDSVELMFIEDHDETFHRTKYTNLLTKKAKTPFIAVWDADVIVNPVQIQLSALKLRQGVVDFIFPYDGRFLDTGPIYRGVFMTNGDLNFLERRSDRMVIPYTTNACGGAFFATREAYVIAGMDNENFYGWGSEDNERLKRWQILQMRIMRVKGPMFHLFHPRGINSQFKSTESKLASTREFRRIERMSKSELLQEIRTWNR